MRLQNLPRYKKALGCVPNATNYSLTRKLWCTFAKTARINCVNNVLKKLRKSKIKYNNHSKLITKLINILPI